MTKVLHIEFSAAKKTKQNCYLLCNKDKRVSFTSCSPEKWNTKHSYFLYVGTIKCVGNIKQLCILWERKKKSFQPQQQQLAKRKHGHKLEKTKLCLFTDTGPQGLAEYDATVITKPPPRRCRRQALSHKRSLSERSKAAQSYP